MEELSQLSLAATQIKHHFTQQGLFTSSSDHLREADTTRATEKLHAIFSKPNMV